MARPRRFGHAWGVKLRVFIGLALGWACGGAPAAGWAQDGTGGGQGAAGAEGLTPLQRDVNLAIDRAVTYLVGRQAADGGWPEGHVTGGDAALEVLCILERPRDVAVWGIGAGYDDLDAEAQRAVDAGITYLIDNDESLWSGDWRAAHSNRTGVNLMALAVYETTGGRQDVVEGATLAELIANGVKALRDMRGPAGGWRYTVWDERGDVSCAQLAAGGLAAAAQVDEAHGEALPELLPWLSTCRNDAGGYGYTPGNTPALTTSASGLWAALLAGADEGDLRRTRAWIRQRWEVLPLHFYWMWTVSKALGTADNVLGPVEDGEFDWYGDLARYLLDLQQPDGSWAGGQWSGVDLATAWACLTLERSLGGACDDPDEDGWCSSDDLCPTIFDPDQNDSDADGVGDACDNCRLNRNASQYDADADGLGDACDKNLCEGPDCPTPGSVPGGAPGPPGEDGAPGGGDIAPEPTGPDPQDRRRAAPGALDPDDRASGCACDPASAWSSALRDRGLGWPPRR